MKKFILKDKRKFIISMTILIGIIIIAIWAIVSVNNNKTRSAKETLADVIQEDDALLANEESINEVVLGVEEENENMPEENIKEQNNETEDIKNLDEKSTEVDTTKKENNEKANKAKYYIKVNYQANVVTIYTKDSNGEYTVPYRAMICSSGSATPKSGVYKMSNKYRWLSLFGGVSGQYCSRITGHILFHSVPYLEKKNDTLEYWEYDKLGTTASAGCIRLEVKNAKWIYDNCSAGTYVEFYASSDPGPLGKPSAQKISSNETCRNWDPTDTAQGNPWTTYKEESSNNRIEDNNINSNKINGNTNESAQNTNNTVKNENQNHNIISNSTNNQTVKNEIANNIIKDNTTAANGSKVNDTKQNNIIQNKTNSNSSVTQNKTADNVTNSNKDSEKTSTINAGKNTEK